MSHALSQNKFIVCNRNLLEIYMRKFSINNIVTQQTEFFFFSIILAVIQYFGIFDAFSDVTENKIYQFFIDSQSIRDEFD